MHIHMTIPTGKMGQFEEIEDTELYSKGHCAFNLWSLISASFIPSGNCVLMAKTMFWEVTVSPWPLILSHQNQKSWSLSLGECFDHIWRNPLEAITRLKLHFVGSPWPLIPQSKIGWSSTPRGHLRQKFFYAATETSQLQCYTFASS